MYLEFFGLKEFPFEITSDPDYFYQSQKHKRAVACLIYGIKYRKGIITITGDVGTGKTTLCKYLLSKLSKEIKTSFILNPYFSDVQLLNLIAQDFGLKPKRKNRLDIVKELTDFLLEVNSLGGNAVLIVDEAQNLKPRQLEQIRLLSNLETNKHKLLQIILVGQNELEDILKSENLRQISQRIAVKFNITPLEFEEIKPYILHRLKTAGAQREIFKPECYELIYEFSKGVPRKINILCDRALLAGFVENEKIINKEIILKCIEELK